MNVLLVNPPDPNSLDPKLEPPLGLMYLSSYLKANNINCKIVDLAFFQKNDWLTILSNEKADLYGLTTYSSSLTEADIISKLIKSCHPEAKIIWGGPHASFEWLSSFMQCPELDFVAIGEGEDILLDLCKNFGKEQLYPSIAGLANRNGKFLFASNLRAPKKNIDSFPPTDRLGVPIKNYTRKVDGIQSTPVISSRGCGYSCRFCCSKYFWGPPRFHSIERIKDELKEIKGLGFGAVHFWDDTFTFQNDRLYKILDALKELNFVFRCNGNLRTDTKKLLKKLYDSNCREIGYGIESGDQKVLDIINKGTTVERNKQVLKWAKEVGLTVKAYLMVGNPGETWDSIQKTIDFIKETGPELYTLSSFVPLPGSEFWCKKNEYGIKLRTKNWDNYFVIGRNNEGGFTHDTEFMTAEEIADARKFLLRELPKQTGKLQDYYSRVQNDL